MLGQTSLSSPSLSALAARSGPSPETVPPSIGVQFHPRTQQVRRSSESENLQLKYHKICLKTKSAVSPSAGDCWYHIPTPAKQKLKQVSVGRTSVYAVDENGKSSACVASSLVLKELLSDFVKLLSCR